VEIEIGLPGRSHWLTAAAIGFLALALAGLALLGRAVSPVESGHLVVLSPERWQAVGLQRQALAETQKLQEDISALHGLLEAGQPDPVQAMLLAERVFARQREGTSATAAARQAVTDAAAEAARYMTGASTRQQALDAYAGAVARVEVLSASKARDR
jgi:hypothetical protein